MTANPAWPVEAVFEDIERKVPADMVVAVAGESTISTPLSSGMVNRGSAGRPYTFSSLPPQ